MIDCNREQSNDVAFHTGDLLREEATICSIYYLGNPNLNGIFPGMFSKHVANPKLTQVRHRM
jgi:hypothetical protein